MNIFLKSTVGRPTFASEVAGAVAPAQPAQWWEEGVPGYLIGHPFAPGGVLVIGGKLIGSRVLFWAGVGICAYGLYDLARQKGWIT